MVGEACRGSCDAEHPIAGAPSKKYVVSALSVPGVYKTHMQSPHDLNYHDVDMTPRIFPMEWSIIIKMIPLCCVKFSSILDRWSRAHCASQLLCPLTPGCRLNNALCRVAALDRNNEL